MSLHTDTFRNVTGPSLSVSYASPDEAKPVNDHPRPISVNILLVLVHVLVVVALLISKRGFAVYPVHDSPAHCNGDLVRAAAAWP